MTYVEFLYGIEDQSYEKRARAIGFLMNFRVLHTTNETALLLSALKHRYDRKGKMKSLTDIFIASQAVENKLMLVSKDQDFADMDELNKTIL